MVRLTSSNKKNKDSNTIDNNGSNKNLGNIWQNYQQFYRLAQF